MKFHRFWSPSSPYSLSNISKRRFVNEAIDSSRYIEGIRLKSRCSRERRQLQCRTSLLRSVSKPRDDQAPLSISGLSLNNGKQGELVEHCRQEAETRMEICDHEALPATSLSCVSTAAERPSLNKMNRKFRELYAREQEKREKFRASQNELLLQSRPSLEQAWEASSAMSSQDSNGRGSLEEART